jgi:hypothetical protein
VTGVGTVPMFASLLLEHSGFRVRARSTDPAHLAWLAEFMSPWFSALNHGRRVDAMVTLECDADKHARLLSTAPPPETTSRIDTFVLDSRVVRHPVWREQDAERLLLDEELGVFYRVSRRQPRVQIVARNDHASARVALMRVVRELAMIHARHAGRPLLHAAALEIDGRGIALVGPKRSGKTTLLLHLLRAPGARFVANDRVFVNLDGSPPQLTGLPSIVALRAGTLELFPEFAARAGGLRYAFWQTRAEARRNDGEHTLAEGTDITPRQLCDLARVEPAVHAPLAALVFPQANGAGSERRGRPGIERLDPAMAERRLRESLFGGTNSRVQSAAFDLLPGGNANGASPDAYCSTLARAVPAFDYVVVPGAFAAPGAVATFAERLACS